MFVLRQIKRQISRIIIYLVSLLVSFSVYAERISVAVPDLPGIVKFAEDGTLRGPLSELLREVELATGHRFELSVYPFPRVVQLVKTGNVDIGIFLRSSPRDQFAKPLFQMGTTNVLAVGLKELHLEKPEDFMGLVVGMLRNGAELIPPYSNQDFKLVEYIDHNGGLRMLKARRFDAMIAPDFRLFKALKDTSTPMSTLSKPHIVIRRGLWAYWSKQSNKIGLMAQIQAIGVEIVGERAEQSLVNLGKGNE